MEDRQRVWQLYGWYTGLMLCGSCFGVVAWVSRIMFLVYRFNWTFNFTNLAERYSLRALDLSWTAVFVAACVQRLPLCVYVTVWSGTPWSSCSSASPSSWCSTACRTQRRSAVRR